MRPFFHLLGPEGCSRIEVVATDMNDASLEQALAQCPQFEIAYDLFYVVVRYGGRARARAGDQR